MSIPALATTDGFLLRAAAALIPCCRSGRPMAVRSKAVWALANLCSAASKLGLSESSGDDSGDAANSTKFDGSSRRT